MSEEVAYKTLRASIARIGEGEGVTGMQESALATLVHLAINNITKMSELSRENAGLSGRTIVNIADTAIAIIDNDDSIDDLTSFIQESLSKPKLTPLTHVPRFPQYPAIITTTPTPVDEAPALPSYIPPYLPKLPPAHTYVAPDLTTGKADNALSNKKREFDIGVMDTLLNTIDEEEARLMRNEGEYMHTNKNPRLE